MVVSVWTIDLINHGYGHLLPRTLFEHDFVFVIVFAMLHLIFERLLNNPPSYQVGRRWMGLPYRLVVLVVDDRLSMTATFVFAVAVAVAVVVMVMSMLMLMKGRSNVFSL